MKKHYSGRILSGIIILVGILGGLHEISILADVEASAIQVIQIYVQALFMVITSYITGKMIENFFLIKE